MAKRLQDIITPAPELKLIRLCTCGCGEKCDDEYQWHMIDGEPFATLNCWENHYRAFINYGERVTFEDGDSMSWEKFKSDYRLVTYG